MRSRLSKAIIDGGVKAVETAGRNPEQVLPALKDAGIKVIHPIRDPRDSCVAYFNQMEETAKCDFSPMWVETFTKESARVPWGYLAA